MVPGELRALVNLCLVYRYDRDAHHSQTHVVVVFAVNEEDEDALVRSFVREPPHPPPTSTHVRDTPDIFEGRSR